ncbi:MAG: UvrB/UvrC motif-containing protein [Clostridia bacterium]|nr:UvrB/UvrC motif-containing protein [Clostridia bacterium]
MKCERCENDASFFYNETVNGKKKSLALCADCATKAGFFMGSAATALENDLYSALFQKKQPHTQKLCPTCGTAWQTITANGMVGCPDCYKTFREELGVSIRRLHGNTRHVGRAPAKHGATREKENRISALRAALKTAIAAENFEEAARLRDEIRAAEQA